MARRLRVSRRTLVPENALPGALIGWHTLCFSSLLQEEIDYCP